MTVAGQPGRVRVKICGITSMEDARMAAAAGADAIGLNFVGGPRLLDVERAGAILSALPPVCTSVALVDVERDDIAAPIRGLLERHLVSHLQLYGQVTARAVRRLAEQGFRLFLVHAVEASRFPGSLVEELGRFSADDLAAVLLDAHHPGLQGGTGKTADWEAIAEARRENRELNRLPLILAGGLRPENVAEAVRIVRPWMVDASSGVESRPGVKDFRRMAALAGEANAGWCSGEPSIEY